MKIHRTRYRNSSLRVAGLAMMVVANTTMLLARPTQFLTIDRLDALKGLLMGIAIALMLLSLVRAKRCENEPTESIR